MRILEPKNKFDLNHKLAGKFVKREAIARHFAGQNMTRIWWAKLRPGVLRLNSGSAQVKAAAAMFVG